MGTNTNSFRYWARLFFVPMALLFLSAPALAKSKSATSTSKSVGFTRLETGQYLLEVMVDQQGPFVFMLDTAATRTCIFEKTQRKLGLTEIPDGEAFISGLTESRIRPTTKVSSISFGGRIFEDHNVVILEDWDLPEQQIDGILGIELLDDLVLSFTHNGDRLRIRDRFNPQAIKFKGWDKIKLIPNPYPGEDYGLMFTGAKIGRSLIPTVLDTGANFTTISWSSVEGTRLEKEKKRLREEWTIQGAVGEFSPRLVVRLDKINIGGVVLPKHELLLMDLDDFPVNGNGKYPLIVAGIDLMGGQDFVLDFKEDKLYIKPRGRKWNLRAKASRMGHPEGL